MREISKKSLNILFFFWQPLNFLEKKTLNNINEKETSLDEFLNHFNDNV